MFSFDTGRKAPSVFDMSFVAVPKGSVPMKAMVITKNGPPGGLQLQEVAKPIPQANEILIRVHAGTVTRGDVMLHQLHPLLFLPLRLFGVRRKRIPGHELAGKIEAVGKDVRRFVVGDEVFGTTTGLEVGANAEYICLPETWSSGVLATKPSNSSYEEAAALPVGGMTALYFLRQGNIQSGQKILIYGASGSVGTFAVQLARYFGADVTAACSTRNISLVKSLGAHQVLDYTKEDVINRGEKYDLIFDAVGKFDRSQRKNALKPNGRFLSIQGSTSEKLEALLFLKDLVEAGQIRSVIDRCYPLEQVAEAHRYVETGHKAGNVIITITS